VGSGREGVTSVCAGEVHCGDMKFQICTRRIQANVCILGTALPRLVE
jgi:hypothetical protein